MNMNFVGTMLYAFSIGSWSRYIFSKLVMLLIIPDVCSFFHGCVFACHFVDTLILLAVSQFQEMNLLVEADQPGNQLDNYISRLNAILSQKAAGILELQNQLAHFQRRLKEHNVLVSSGN